MPRKALTQLKVDKLRPDPRKRLEVPDHLYPQLRLVVQPSGARSFAVRARVGGKPAKITLKPGLDLKDAREAARDLLARIAAGDDPRVAKRRAKATTLGGVAELYLKDTAGQVRPKTRIERERHLRRDWRPLHHRPLAELRKGEIAARLLEIKDEAGPIAANRSRTTLHNLFEWAIDQDLVEANVVAATRRPLRREPRGERVLTPAERREVWAATEGGSDHDDIVRLALMLGQRRGEVGGMRRAELDLDKALWSLAAERTKNGLPHLVPLPRQAVEVIKARLRRGDREFVFGEGDSPFSGYSRAKRRLDRRVLEGRQRAAVEQGGDPEKVEAMPHWTIHDLRRSMSTAMNEELGIAPHVVEAVINHVSGEAKKGVAGTYNKALYLRERTRALQAWADHLTDAGPERVVALAAAR
ncbi:MAG TPA: site-specific integrase [Geminicoccaceae bacterium]|nr:site-specific integrase [Geminicoccaceae bacterium]